MSQHVNNYRSDSSQQNNAYLYAILAWCTSGQVLTSGRESLLPRPEVEKQPKSLQMHRTNITMNEFNPLFISSLSSTGADARSSCS